MCHGWGVEQGVGVEDKKNLHARTHTIKFKLLNLKCPSDRAHPISACPGMSLECLLFQGPLEHVPASRTVRPGPRLANSRFSDFSFYYFLRTTFPGGEL